MMLTAGKGKKGNLTQTIFLNYKQITAITKMLPKLLIFSQIIQHSNKDMFPLSSVGILFFISMSKYTIEILPFFGAEFQHRISHFLARNWKCRRACK